MFYTSNLVENIFVVFKEPSLTALTTISCVQTSPSLSPALAQQIHRPVRVEITALPHYARPLRRPAGARFDRNQVSS
jgi:hypothetical protein